MQIGNGNIIFLKDEKEQVKYTCECLSDPY